MTKSKGININLDFFDKVTTKDKAFLSRQLATMLSSGLPIDRALSILSTQSRKKIIKSALEQISKDLEGGQSFSAAIKRHPKVFDKVYVNMVVSGEAVGKLAEVLANMADQLEKQSDFNGKIQSAIMYPVFIVIVMGVIVFLMMTKVVPQLEQIFKESGAQLPWTTKLLISTSGFISNYWWLTLVIIAVLVIGIKIFLATEIGIYTLSKIQVNFPGGIGKDVYMARFSRTLGMLLQSGTPIIDAVKITSEVMNNIIYQKSLNNVARQLERGIPMSVPMEKDPVYPLIIPQMIMVGEQTGRMDEVLNKLASYYENQSSDRVKTLSSLFEPALIVLIGVGVGFVVFSILMPIYQIVQMQ